MKIKMKLIEKKRIKKKIKVYMKKKSKIKALKILRT